MCLPVSLNAEVLVVVVVVGCVQYTFVNGAKSDTKRINFGVPQGSVLGPLFFLLYINNIYRAVDDTIIRLFADDTSLLIYDQNLNTLKNKASHAFPGLFDWCKANRLTISVAKTDFVLFHTQNKPMEQNLKEIVTDEISIERVTNIKYLGVIIDEKLNWNMHINFVCDSLVKFFGIFNHIKHKVTQKVVRQLYYGFIYSKIAYGLEVYGYTSVSNVSKIQTMQNKLLKLILKLDIRTRTNTVLKMLNILKIEDIHKTIVLAFVNSCVMNKCPAIFELL